jgi:hypothetical protein
MAKVSVNVPYIMDIVEKSKLNNADFGRTIGVGEHWIRNTKYRGTVQDYTIDMLCRVYGADRVRLLMPVPYQSKPTKTAVETPTGNNEILVVIANGLLRVENKLDRLLKALGEEVK